MAAAPPRRILMVTYWYPPVPGAGAQRAAGFARHLPALGWSPTVLAADAAARLWPGRARQQPPADDGVTAWCVPDLVAPANLFSDFAGPPPRRPRWLSQRLFPDRFRFWARRAMRCAARDLADQPFDIVWTTFPPASAVLVGLDAAQRLDRPLVLDLRDPWIGPGGYSPDRPRRLHAHQALERRAVRAAAAVTAVSEAMWHDVAERCGVPRERGIVIPNGFDPARCPPLDLSPLPADRPTLAHVGSVTVRNCPNRFLTSLAAIPEPRRACRLRFVGNLSPGYVARLGLAQTVETTGMLSPDAAWRATLAADALLLLVGEYVGRWGHNTKLFEYLRAARPILCVEESPGSNDAALLRQIAPQRSVFARFDDPASIERGLADVASLARAAPRRTLDDSPALRAYDRAALAARLTDRLDRLAPPRGPAAAG